MGSCFMLFLVWFYFVWFSFWWFPVSSSVVVNFILIVLLFGFCYPFVHGVCTISLTLSQQKYSFLTQWTNFNNLPSLWYIQIQSLYTSAIFFFCWSTKPFSSSNGGESISEKRIGPNGTGLLVECLILSGIVKTGAALRFCSVLSCWTGLSEFRNGIFLWIGWYLRFYIIISFSHDNCCEKLWMKLTVQPFFSLSDHLIVIILLAFVNCCRHLLL